MTPQVVDNFKLNGKRILVTGASSGIGKQVCVHIAALGGKVVLTGRNETRLNETLQLLEGEGHIIYPADLTNDDEINALASAIAPIDGLVHSAGMVSPSTTKFILRKQVEDVFNVNYLSVVLLTTALFRKRKFNPNSSCVFLSSFAAKFPFPGGSVYASTKAALEAYSKTLAVENAASGLRANCVLPALVRTEIYNQTFSINYGEQGEERRLKYEHFYLHGIGQPEQVANTITFLLSDASSWITGQSIVLDGGYLLGILSKSIE